MIEQKKEWYAVKGLYRWYLKESGETLKVEERVLLFDTTSFDTAIDLAEKEAAEYCEEDEQANFLIEPMGWWNAYLIGEEKIESGAEIYSRLMSSSLGPEAFIKRYCPKSHDN
jgi:hypothetical protein